MIDPEQHYHERLRQFAAERVEPGGIVLLGSSHLEWFDAPRMLPGRRFVNRGIASDRLGLTERGILHRLDSSVFDCQPAFIVFENGANDLGELWRNGTPPMEASIACYEHVVATIRTRLPAVPMLIVNVLPTTGRCAGLNPFVREFNPHVARIAAQHGCTHMDFCSVVVSAAGELRAELTEDGLHLNECGYTLFADRLDPHLPHS
jgi:lysophospholipase L1-like esterase